MESFVYEDMARLESKHWWFVARRAILKSLIDRHSGPGKVLEVGAGTGGNLELFAGEVSALEPSEDAIQFLEKKGANVIKGKLGDSGVDSDYDLVACLDVIEHLDDDIAGTNEVFKLLKPGGIYLSTVPAFQSLWSEHDVVHHHKRRYLKSNYLEILKAAGFEISFSSYFNFILFPIALVGRLLGQTGAGMPNSVLNFVFQKIFSFERFLLKFLRFPVGLSIVVVCKKPIA